MISIIVPVYRNETTLEALYRQVVAVLPTSAYEFIFVNDGSPDHSLEVLKTLTENNECVSVISLSHNMGQNYALAMGLKYCQGERAVLMDADLQDPPSAIPLLMEHLTAPYSAVFAGRRGNYSAWSRRLTSIIFKFTLAVLSGFRLPPDAGLFVALNRTMIDHINENYLPGDYIISIMAQSGQKMTSIPIIRISSEQTNYTFKMRLKLGINAVRSLLGLKKKLTKEPPQVEFWGFNTESSP